jgi:hypothetical protein
MASPGFVGFITGRQVGVPCRHQIACNGHSEIIPNLGAAPTPSRLDNLSARDFLTRANSNRFAKRALALVPLVAYPSQTRL